MLHATTSSEGRRFGSTRASTSHNLVFVEINRGAVAAWSGAVCGGAAAVAAVLATVEGPAWRPVVIGFISLAVLALVVLLWTGLKPVRSWIRELMPHRQPPPMPALTNRWRYTPVAFDVGTLANLSHKAFSHQSYMRQYEDKPPAFRTGAFVACGALGEDEPTAEYLRSNMRKFLAQPALLSLIGMFTNIHPAARWDSQPGRGRFNLEADLLRPVSDTPIASALLLLPESGVRRYGKDQAGAELYLHIDLPMNGGVPVGGVPERAGLAEWHDRFIAALALPGLLGRFLDSIGLTTSDEPAARFAVQIQARVVNQLGIEEVVDFGELPSLSQSRYSVQFDGWAVADPEGRPGPAISKRLLTELCESIGRSGYGPLLDGLTDG